MNAKAAVATTPEAPEQAELARVLRELRQLCDDFRDELRELVRFREDLEKAVDASESAAYVLERALETWAEATKPADGAGAEP